VDPFVSFWKLTADMAVGQDPADRLGHRYGAELVPRGAVLDVVLGQAYGRTVAGLGKPVDRVG
jgi:hypothetical protein